MNVKIVCDECHKKMGMAKLPYRPKMKFDGSFTHIKHFCKECR